MNVRQLIKELQSMPPDAVVSHLWDGEARTVIEHVWLAKDGSVVTAESGMVCYSDHSRPIGAPTETEDHYWESPSLPTSGEGT